MKKIAGAMALGVVLAAGSVTAAEAAPKSFKVTVKLSKSTAEVGSKVKVTGKVAGQSAKSLKGKKVTVQRKYVGGKWQKVGTATIKSNRTFSLSTKLVKGGNTSYRVVKARSGKIKAGASAVRTTAVYKWIDLTTAPSMGFSFGLHNHPVTLSGKKYARSLQGMGQLMSGFRAVGCTTFTTTIGFPDRERSQLAITDSQELSGVSGKISGSPQTEHGPYVVTRDQVKKVTVNFAQAELVTLINTTQTASQPGTAVMADPLVRCNSDSLGQVPDAWMFVAS